MHMNILVAYKGAAEPVADFPETTMSSLQERIDSPYVHVLRVSYIRPDGRLAVSSPDVISDGVGRLMTIYEALEASEVFVLPGHSRESVTGRLLGKMLADAGYACEAGLELEGIELVGYKIAGDEMHFVD